MDYASNFTGGINYPVIVKHLPKYTGPSSTRWPSNRTGRRIAPKPKSKLDEIGEHVGLAPQFVGEHGRMA